MICSICDSTGLVPSGPTILPPGVVLVPFSLLAVAGSYASNTDFLLLLYRPLETQNWQKALKKSTKSGKHGRKDRRGFSNLSRVVKTFQTLLYL